jgi:hypothetical protein
LILSAGNPSKERDLDHRWHGRAAMAGAKRTKTGGQERSGFLDRLHGWRPRNGWKPARTALLASPGIGFRHASFSDPQ